MPNTDGQPECHRRQQYGRRRQWAISEVARPEPADQRPARTIRTPANDRVIRALTSTFGQFNVDAKVVGFLRGPSVTQYEVELGPGVKGGKSPTSAAQHRHAVASSDVRINHRFPANPPSASEIPERGSRNHCAWATYCAPTKAVGDPDPVLSGIGKGTSKATS